MIVYFIHLIILQIGLHLPLFVEHVCCKVSNIIWKDVSVLVGLGEVGECNPLSEGMPMDFQVFFFNVITQHVWQSIRCYKNRNILPSLLRMLVFGFTYIALSFKEEL